MFTMVCWAEHKSPEDKQAILLQARKQCCIRRVAFNRITENPNLSTLTLTKQLLNNYCSTYLCLDWRYVEHAVADAKALYDAQKELLELYIEQVKAEIEALEEGKNKLLDKIRVCEVEGKTWKVKKLERKLRRAEGKIEKAKRRLSRLEKLKGEKWNLEGCFWRQKASRGYGEGES